LWRIVCFVVGFIFIFFFEFMHAINATNKPYFSMPRGMLMVNAIFPKGGIWDQNMCCETKRLCRTLVMNNM
jgi:hypothetical protein